jgi:hypothetical protein
LSSNTAVACGTQCFPRNITIIGIPFGIVICIGIIYHGIAPTLTVHLRLQSEVGLATAVAVGSWHHEGTISANEQSVATHDELRIAQAPEAIRDIHDDADDTVPL